MRHAATGREDKHVGQVVQLRAVNGCKQECVAWVHCRTLGHEHTASDDGCHLVVRRLHAQEDLAVVERRGGRVRRLGHTKKAARLVDGQVALANDSLPKGTVDQLEHA